MNKHISKDTLNSTITREEISHFCELTRIGATDQEKDDLARDLTSIFEYVQQISGVVIPEGFDAQYAHTNRMRDDSFTYAMRQYTDVLLEALPRREGDYAVVHKVLNKIK